MTSPTCAFAYCPAFDQAEVWVYSLKVPHPYSISEDHASIEVCPFHAGVLRLNEKDSDFHLISRNKLCEHDNPDTWEWKFNSGNPWFVCMHCLNKVTDLRGATRLFGDAWVDRDS